MYLHCNGGNNYEQEALCREIKGTRIQERKLTAKPSLLNDRNLLPIRSRSLCGGDASRSASYNKVVVIKPAHVMLCLFSVSLLSTYADLVCFVL